jgi:hypothetical protein
MDWNDETLIVEMKCNDETLIDGWNVTTKRSWRWNNMPTKRSLGHETLQRQNAPVDGLKNGRGLPAGGVCKPARFNGGRSLS